MGCIQSAISSTIFSVIHTIIINTIQLGICHPHPRKLQSKVWNDCHGQESFHNPNNITAIKLRDIFNPVCSSSLSSPWLLQFPHEICCNSPLLFIHKWLCQQWLCLCVILNILSIFVCSVFMSCCVVALVLIPLNLYDYSELQNHTR